MKAKKLLKKIKEYCKRDDINCSDCKYSEVCCLLARNWNINEIMSKVKEKD